MKNSQANLEKMNNFDDLCLCLVAQSCSTICDPMDCSPFGSSVHGDSPSKHTRVGCHALLQSIFPTQGSNPGFPHCRQILYQLSHKWSPRILEWALCLFSSLSLLQPVWLRNWTRVSCLAGGFFTNWVIREALVIMSTKPSIMSTKKKKSMYIP